MHSMELSAGNFFLRSMPPLLQPEEGFSTDVVALPLGVSPTFSDFNTYLTLSYELDIWGQIRNATAEALANYLAQVEVRRFVVETLVTSVAATYVQLRQFDMQLAISKNTYNSRVESYKLANLRYKEGLTSELEVIQAESEIQDAEVQVLQLEILIPQTENLLSVLIGQNPGPIVRGQPLNQLVMPPCVPAGLPSELLQQRPDIRQAKYQLIAANRGIDVAWANFFPSFSLTGALGTESTQLNRLFTHPTKSWYITGSVLQPLFAGGSIYYNYKESQAVAQEALYNYASIIQNSFKEVDDALIGHQLTLELVEVLKKQVVVLTEYLHLSTLRYMNGQTDYLNVLDAERKLFQSQLDYATQLSNSFLTLINLYKALGGGWVVDADNEAIAETDCDCNL